MAVVVEKIANSAPTRGKFQVPGRRIASKYWYFSGQTSLSSGIDLSFHLKGKSTQNKSTP